MPSFAQCGQFLCSGSCLDEHEEKHLRLTATPQGPVESAAEDVPLPKVRGITVRGTWLGGRMRPRSSWHPGCQ